MLRRKPIRHFTNDLDKSWTADDFLDLVVWYEAAGKMYGFQLGYDRFGYHRAATWTFDRGFTHARVDEYPGMSMGMSPVLTWCADFPWKNVLREFMARSLQLDPEIRQFIAAQIIENGPRQQVTSE